MIRTIRRTVPRPMYIRLPPFCRLLPFPCFGREKTSHFSAGSSAQKQSLGVFDDPQHRQEHVDQSRERDREHRDERAAPGRDYGRDRRRNGHPPDQALLRRGSRPGRDRTARTAESESPARPRWRPLPRRGQPERNPRCLNEANQDGVTPSCFSRSSRRSSSSYAPLYPEDAPSSARKPALLDSQ
jgi:hypothetical protein